MMRPVVFIVIPSPRDSVPPWSAGINRAERWIEGREHGRANPPAGVAARQSPGARDGGGVEVYVGGNAVGVSQVYYPPPLASVPVWNSYGATVRWSDIGETTCSVARALSVVGDRWTLLVLRDAFLGVRRFEDFQADLGTSRHRLADRLRKLVAHDVLERVPYATRPPRYEYRLTEKGRDLYPVVVSLTRWGDRWMAGRHGPPVRLVHRGCGREVMPALTCPACAAPVSARDMEARPGPALAKAWQRGRAYRPRQMKEDVR